MPDDSSTQVPRWHWVWLAPVGLLVLLLVETHTLPYSFHVLHLGWQRWSWGAFISPSAAFCLSVVVASVMAPIQGVIMAARLVFSRTDQRVGKRRHLGALLILVVVLLLPFVTDAFIWGSFPFTFDRAGIGRLRLIPFIPWPDAPLGTY